jgi:hypothetical protein
MIHGGLDEVVVILMILDEVIRVRFGDLLIFEGIGIFVVCLMIFMNCHETLVDYGVAVCSSMCS